MTKEVDLYLRDGVPTPDIPEVVPPLKIKKCDNSSPPNHSEAGIATEYVHDGLPSPITYSHK